MMREAAQTRRAAVEEGLAYDPVAARDAIRDVAASKLSRLDRKPRVVGVWFDRGWETANLEPALDMTAQLVRIDLSGVPDTERIDEVLLRGVSKAVSEGGVDVLFTYLSAEHVAPETIAEIGRRGILTVNMSLDDDIAFRSHAAVAPVFDVSWTSHRSACESYLLAGGRPLWLPEGASPTLFRRLDLERDKKVSFIGARYGMRPRYVHHLARKGVDVECYGQGWDRGFIDFNTMNEVINRSEINLGFAGRSFSARVTKLKMRDFEVPMAGGLYLTQHVDELADYFELGSEIVTYRTKEDLVEQIDRLLSSPKDAEEIRRAGEQRARRDHRWEQRFAELFAIAGLTSA